MFVEDVVPAKLDQFFARLDAVEIQVKYGQAAAPVFMHQREGRAGHSARIADPIGDSLRQMGFARAQRTHQAKHVTRARGRPQLAPQGDGGCKIRQVAAWHAHNLADSAEFASGDPRIIDIPAGIPHHSAMQDFSQNHNVLAAAQAVPADRATFIRRTYVHLAVSIGLFAFLEAALVRSGMGRIMLEAMGTSRFSWLLVMVGFMAVSWVADRWARGESSQGMQYAGLGLYIVAEAVLFLPVLTLASIWAPSVIGQAAVLTGALVAGLTAVAFITRKDFSFLGPILAIGGIVALGIIVLSIFTGFNLGTVFSGVMILFAGASVLYSTSNILHQYRVDQHVAAALSLFASVALLFWYILRLLMSLNRN